MFKSILFLRYLHLDIYYVRSVYINVICDHIYPPVHYYTGLPRIPTVIATSVTLTAHTYTASGFAHPCINSLHVHHWLPSRTLPLVAAFNRTPLAASLTRTSLAASLTRTTLAVSLAECTSAFITRPTYPPSLPVHR